MDYATAGAAQAQLAPNTMPELGRLKAAAERIARAYNNVDNFLIRFHGPRPESANGPADEHDVGYRNDLDCLFKQIDRLEDVVRALDAIG